MTTNCWAGLCTDDHDWLIVATKNIIWCYQLYPMPCKYFYVNMCIQMLSPETTFSHKIMNLKVVSATFYVFSTTFFTDLFCISGREHLWNKEKRFLFHFKSSFHWDNQILTFHVLKCLSMKCGTHFSEYLIALLVHI